jgi:hypothetical protein
MIRNAIICKKMLEKMIEKMATSLSGNLYGGVIVQETCRDGVCKLK